MAITASKYVPPHLRNKGKKHQEKTQKQAKTKKVEATNQAPPVKPHCELFLADLPVSLRVVQTLASFFHPYGEISHVQLIQPSDKMPENCLKWISEEDFAGRYCAIVEFQTARVAKFVVGVLRKRIETMNFRVGLLKPGLAEEMATQEQRLFESVYTPTSSFSKTQKSILKEKQSNANQYSSEESSEIENAHSRKRSTLLINRTSDGAYWTGSSSDYSLHSSGSGGSDSEHDKKVLAHYDTSDDDDIDLLSLAIKNGIKVTKDY